LVAAITRFGQTPDGEPVDRITLESDRLKVSLLTLGARLQHVTFDGSPDLVIGRSSVDAYFDIAPFAGPIVAPVVNRIAGAAAELDGQALMFEANQDGRHSLHSGRIGAHLAIWTVEEAEPAKVTMRHIMPDGHLGFPGNRIIRAAYAVDGTELHLAIQAETDAPTLMNPALHGVWNLDGSADWSGHGLEIPATGILEIDDDILPTGRILDLDGSAFDLRSGGPPPSNLDHNYCFPSDGALRCLAKLTGASGRALEILSDAPGLQVFTRMRHSIALEPQKWPDAPHHRAFPSINLMPGEVFWQKSIYRFSSPKQ
jgi:aldose 1-epimerase